MGDELSDREDRHAAAQRIEALLRELETLRGPGVPAAEMRARMRVKAWQCQRLAQTHADLLDHPRYGAAAAFFLSDLYGPKDHTARDADLGRVLPKLVKLLPPAALATLTDALALDVLSESLDADMAHRLMGGVADPDSVAIDEAAYAQVYRACHREAERERQLALVDAIGRSLDRLTRMPLLSTTLKLMKGPAELAGLGDLHGFLHRGFAAFRQMRGADEFLERILTEERRLMRRWLQPGDGPDGCA